MSSYREHGTDIPAITNAQEAHAVDMRRRMIKYSISMGIRMVCIILVFVVTGWLQWVFIAGAVLLPYFAVVLANVGSDSETMERSSLLLDRPPQRELEGGADQQARDAAAGPEDRQEDADIVPGEIVPEDESHET